jgi:hypothetical protein
MNNWFAAAAAGVLALFGVGGQPATTTTPNFNDGTTTHKAQRDARVSSTTKTSVNIMCVSAAVSTRETSLSAGAATYTSAINTAYATRAAALATAYGLSGNDNIRSAVKSSWKQFTTTTQGAKRAWQKSRESTWQTFRTAIKSCGTGAATVSDIENYGSEFN